MYSRTLPLLRSQAPGERIGWWQDKPINNGVFAAHINHTANNLPPRRFVINLCADRYLFLVGFAAIILQRQTNLLPSSRVKKEIDDISETYPDSFILTDRQVREWMTHEEGEPEVMLPEVPFDHVAAIVFTSGSTGRPRPNPKRWGDLVRGGRLAQHRFGFGKEAGTTIVATVPPQHMYGLETSIMVPLVTGAAIHNGRPFFPEDIRAVLASVPAPRVLVTTPIHLRSCTEAGIQWPSLAFIVSATAPLPHELAARAEGVFDTRVLEIYGFTEAGSIASRRTLEGDVWRLYDDLKISQGYVQGGHLPEPVPMNDIVEPHGDHRFMLLGRRQDLVNVAGKRASLQDLNHKLNSIEGIEDGVFVMPEETDQGTVRLAALVVAPRLSERRILAALGERMDAAFLPRPLHRVEALPRNETGKLPRNALLALLARKRRGNDHS